MATAERYVQRCTWGAEECGWRARPEKTLVSVGVWSLEKGLECRTPRQTVKEGEAWRPTLTNLGVPILDKAPGFPRDPCPLQMAEESRVLHRVEG